MAAFWGPMSNDASFNGRLFGPELPGSGCAASGTWTSSGELHLIVLGEERREFVSGMITIDAGGFNAAGIRVSWEDERGRFALFVDSEADRRVFAASAPPAYAGQLSRAAATQVRVDRRFRLGWGALGITLALPLLLLALFLLKSDSVADWVVRRIPVEQEAKLGNMVLAQTRLQMKIRESGPDVELITKIGKRLVVGSPHSYRWFVADRPEVNAFAAPGGVVVVFSGLINSASSPEEIAGVLAHEVAHAELRHSLRGIVKSLGLRALVSLIVGDVSAGTFSGAATRLTELRFSRDMENEADKDGLKRLVAANIDPNGMILFFEKLSKKQDSPLPLDFISTHPAPAERLENLRREVAGLKGNWVRLDFDLEAVKKTL